MAELRVEVDEVGEDETAVGSLDLPLDLVHPLVVARRVDRVRDAAAGEQILDLADRDDREARGLHAIEQRLARAAAARSRGDWPSA